MEPAAWSIVVSRVALIVRSAVSGFSPVKKLHEGDGSARRGSFLTAVCHWVGFTSLHLNASRDPQRDRRSRQVVRLGLNRPGEFQESSRSRSHHSEQRMRLNRSERFPLVPCRSTDAEAQPFFPAR